MGSITGKNYVIDVFGESHSEAIGVTIGGIPAGTPIDEGVINEFLKRRRPGGGMHSTARKESDEVKILSGVFNGRATGASFAAIIPNVDVRSKDYANIADVFRPSHADYPAFIKYGGFNDYRGGGQFSGRLTAPLCIAGAVAVEILKKRGIKIAAYISSVGNVSVGSYKDRSVTDFAHIAPLLDKSGESAIIEEIKSAARDGDSVGGVIECAVFGVPTGLGEPIHDTFEGVLARLLFAVPAVKGVEFGAGFDIAKMRGSSANDAYFNDNGRVSAKTNNNGGVVGGMTNGMPVLFRTAIKPTPSIAIKQNSVNKEGNDADIVVTGRHDSCIALRAVPVIEAAAACVIFDLLLENEKWEALKNA